MQGAQSQCGGRQAARQASAASVLRHALWPCQSPGGVLTDCRQGFQGLLRGMGQAGQAEILTNSICQAPGFCQPHRQVRGRCMPACRAALARQVGWQYCATPQLGHISGAGPSMRRQPWQTLPWRSGVGHSTTGASRTTICMILDVLWHERNATSLSEGGFDPPGLL